VKRIPRQIIFLQQKETYKSETYANA